MSKITKAVKHLGMGIGYTAAAAGAATTSLALAFGAHAIASHERQVARARAVRQAEDEVLLANLRLRRMRGW